jgi:hypothetical protein
MEGKCGELESESSVNLREACKAMDPLAITTYSAKICHIYIVAENQGLNRRVGKNDLKTDLGHMTVLRNAFRSGKLPI